MAPMTLRLSDWAFSLKSARRSRKTEKSVGMRRDMRAARIGRKGSRVHHDISHAAWVAHPHCEGFGRVIPLLNVERLQDGSTNLTRLQKKLEEKT